MLNDNILLLTDSYKQTHWKQYPPGTQTIYSYLEARTDKPVMFYGLQYLLKRYLSRNNFHPCMGLVEDICRADEYCRLHFGGADYLNRVGFNKIWKREDGPGLPIRIKAVPEGIILPGRTVLMTIENTDPDFFWLTDFLETLLLEIWYPCTVGTLSWEIKKIIMFYLERTGTPELINFKLHDFGFRGSSSPESAAWGGSAHLVNFMGTDTMPALRMAQEYYCDYPQVGPMPGYSIPAMQHSTITSWGKENEAAAYKNFLDKFPIGPVSIVADSYDIFHACEKIFGEELREQILNRDGVLVIRPDSGDPLEVLPKLLGILGNKFGYTQNQKGYNVLEPHVRLIWGDGIDMAAINNILDCMEHNNWSADNIAFGMGGGLLQKVDRDTYGFAIKCSAAQVNGEWRDVYKETPGKKSKHGRFDSPLLQTVFENGEIVKRYTFDEVRKNAATNQG